MKTYASGTFRGFRISIQPVKGQYLVRINTQSDADVNNVALLQFLTQQGTINKKQQRVESYPHSVAIYIKTPTLGKNIPDTINGIVEPAIQFMTEHGYQAVANIVAEQIYHYTVI